MSEEEKSLNSVNTWSQGRYAPAHSRKLPKELTDQYEKDERFLVRPSARGNAICRAVDPKVAKWIAQRLNLCNNLESENARLKAENESYKNSVQEYMKTEDSLNIENRKLKQENEDLKQNLKCTKDVVSGMCKEQEKLKSQLAKSQERWEELKERISKCVEILSQSEPTHNTPTLLRTYREILKVMQKLEAQDES